MEWSCGSRRASLTTEREWPSVAETQFMKTASQPTDWKLAEVGAPMGIDAKCRPGEGVSLVASGLVALGGLGHPTPYPYPPPPPPPQKSEHQIITSAPRPSRRGGRVVGCSAEPLNQGAHHARPAAAGLTGLSRNRELSAGRRELPAEVQSRSPDDGGCGSRRIGSSRPRTAAYESRRDRTTEYNPGRALNCPTRRDDMSTTRGAR